MNLIKSFLPSTLISIVILIIIEILFRLFTDEIHRHQKLGYSDDVIEVIYGKDSLEDYKTVLIQQSSGVEYHPFVEFKEMPRKGKYVSVSKDNLRCNINNDNSCNLAFGKGVIWVFGGSTVFGYGVKNSETIPAYLQSAMPQYKIVNMGQGSYYSTSESILFNEKLSSGIAPEIAIFIDGLNDFYYNEFPNNSAISPILKKLYSTNNLDIIYKVKTLLKKSRLISLLHHKLDKSWTEMMDSKNHIVKDDKILNKVINRLSFNFLLRTEVGKINDVRVLNILQPVPGYGVGHKFSNVPQNLLRLGDHLNSGRGYELIAEKGLDPRAHYLDLSNFAINTPMFIDSVHYSPEFNKDIAVKIKETLEK